MSYTAVEEQAARNIIARARLARSQKPKGKRRATREQQAIIEAQVEVLHETLTRLDAIVVGCVTELANLQTQLETNAVTQSWLRSERVIMRLRQQVADLEAAT